MRRVRDEYWYALLSVAVLDLAWFLSSSFTLLNSTSVSQIRNEIFVNQ